MDQPVRVSTFGMSSARCNPTAFLVGQVNRRVSWPRPVHAFFFFKKNDTVIAGKKEDMKERKWDEIGNESGKEGRKKETTLTEQNSSSTLSVEPGTFLSLHLWFVMLLPCCHWVPFFIFQIGNGEEKLCDFFISYHLDLTECGCGINARGMLDNWIYNTLSQKFFYYWYSLGRNYMHCFEGGWHQVLCYL